MIPFSHIVEAQGITEDCRYCLQAELEQLSTTMADSSDIEVKAAVSLNAIVFSHIVEAQGITEDCRYCLQAELEQLSTTMADSSDIEVKAAVSLNAIVFCSREVRVIEKVEEKPLDMKKIQSLPGITVYKVKPGDTMWDSARRLLI